ncbi:hypothetical protein Nepgr_011399 [Nepenthes gracilis]|uniref:Uncharacterized protein n=1 Tax=Nepenthes gracilis TaxID=150966 RepID=A0AAD3SE44_NEPGR|nr:hypothetical protein Nepgr_011399 [Nepenthes gracilis]
MSNLFLLDYLYHAIEFDRLSSDLQNTEGKLSTARNTEPRPGDDQNYKRQLRHGEKLKKRAKSAFDVHKNYLEKKLKAFKDQAWLYVSTLDEFRVVCCMVKVVGFSGVVFVAHHNEELVAQIAQPTEFEVVYPLENIQNVVAAREVGTLDKLCADLNVYKAKISLFCRSKSEAKGKERGGKEKMECESIETELRKFEKQFKNDLKMFRLERPVVSPDGLLVLLQMKRLCSISKVSCVISADVTAVTSRLMEDIATAAGISYRVAAAPGTSMVVVDDLPPLSPPSPTQYCFDHWLCKNRSCFLSRDDIVGGDEDVIITDISEDTTSDAASLDVTLEDGLLSKNPQEESVLDTENEVNQMAVVENEGFDSLYVLKANYNDENIQENVSGLVPCQMNISKF